MNIQRIKDSQQSFLALVKEAAQIKELTPKIVGKYLQKHLKIEIEDRMYEHYIVGIEPSEDMTMGNCVILCVSKEEMYRGDYYNDPGYISLPGDSETPHRVKIVSYDLNNVPVFTTVETFGIVDLALGYKNNLSYLDEIRQLMRLNGQEYLDSGSLMAMDLESAGEAIEDLNTVIESLDLTEFSKGEQEILESYKDKKKSSDMKTTANAYMILKKKKKLPVKEANGDKPKGKPVETADNSTEKVYDNFTKTDFANASQDDLGVITLLNSTPKDKWTDENYTMAKDLMDRYAETATESTTIATESVTDVAGNFDADLKGSKVNVTLIREGLNSRGTHFYSREAIKKAVESGLFANKQIYEDHPKPGELPERELKNLVGVITESVWAEEVNGVLEARAIIEIARENTRELLRNKEVAKTIGMSINGLVECRPVTENGKNYKYVTNFQNMKSVDLVTIPGAGGKINEVLESGILDNIKKQGKKMTKIYKHLLNTQIEASKAKYALPALAIERVVESLQSVNLQELVKESGEDADFDVDSLVKAVQSAFEKEVKYVEQIKESVEPKEVIKEVEKVVESVKDAELPNIEAIKTAISAIESVKNLPDGSVDHITESVFYSLMTGEVKDVEAVSKATVETFASYISAVTESGKPHKGSESKTTVVEGDFASRYASKFGIGISAK